MQADERRWRVTDVVGTAMLKDFPLRVWARSRQHTDEVIREFTLMLEGERSGQTNLEAPKALVELADLVMTRFGSMRDEVNSAREAALAAGEDRMDSEVALVPGLPTVLSQIRTVMQMVDEYCRTGDLLTLEREEDDRLLLDWTLSELIAQYEGREPTAWPGPF